MHIASCYDYNQVSILYPYLDLSHGMYLARPLFKYGEGKGVW